VWALAWAGLARGLSFAGQRYPLAGICWAGPVEPEWAGAASIEGASAQVWWEGQHCSAGVLQRGWVLCLRQVGRRALGGVACGGVWWGGVGCAVLPLLDLCLSRCLFLSLPLCEWVGGWGVA
jgi:hypothetical protein